MILVDAEPLLALVNRGHPQHRTCVEALRELREPLATVWPVLAAALSATAAYPQARDAILEMVERGAPRLLELGRDDVPALRKILAKRRAKPLGLAHAALLRVAERDALQTIFTLERPTLAACRLTGGRRLRFVPGAGRTRRPA